MVSPSFLLDDFRLWHVLNRHRCTIPRIYGSALQEGYRAGDRWDGRFRRLHFRARGHVALLARLALYRSLFRLYRCLHRLSRSVRQAASRAAHECRATARERRLAEDHRVAHHFRFLCFSRPASTRLPRWPLAGARLPVLYWGHPDCIVVSLHLLGAEGE